MTNPDEPAGEWGPTPAWAYAVVEVVEPDPTWSALGARLAADVDRHLARWRTAPAEHVGSTAVPGLPAKPVVDVIIPVRDLTDPALVSVLTGAGWAYVPPELDGRAHQRFFVLPDGARRIAHLHVTGPESGTRRADVIRFRDVLRSEPSTRQAYADLKQRLAVDHVDDREAYTAGKATFVESVLARGW